MDAENAGGGLSRLLESVPSADGEVAAQVLAGCPTVDVVASEPYFGSSLPAGALLVVERGFVILRVAPPRTNRSSTLLAHMVGSSRETVTRSLDELQRHGFVARRGHSYRLLVSPECVALATQP